MPNFIHDVSLGGGQQLHDLKTAHSDLMTAIVKHYAVVITWTFSIAHPFTTLLQLAPTNYTIV